MNDISSILFTNNENILSPPKIYFGCNCRNENNCPLDGESLTPNIIYRACITTENDHKFYYGTSEATFKHRHSNHTRDFKYVKCNIQNTIIIQIKNSNLKNNKINYSIKWSLASKRYGYAYSLSCKLFLMEKKWIIKHFDHPNLFKKIRTDN